VDAAHEKGSALNMAASLEIDAVIDPADTRRRLAQALQAALPRADVPVWPMVDAW